jgi:HPt (histidine-containing phosphotransfer) domain-containing protein
VINRATASRLVSDLPDAELAPMIELYLSESAANCDAIEAAVSEGDLQGLNYHIHKEASSSLIFGLEDYGNYLREIEAKIKAGAFSLSQFDLKELSGLAESAQFALRSFFDTAAAEPSA